MKSSSQTNTSNLKVLHIIDSGGLYGAEMVLLHLVAEQIRQGLEPIIASIGEKAIIEKPVETEAIKRGFRVEKFRMHPGPNLIGAYEILRFAWNEDVNILHSHGYKGNILFGFLPRLIRKIPVVATIHGYTSTGNVYSRMRVYEWLDSKALRFMDAVIFVSNAMKSNARFKHINPTKIHVINNGIALPREDSQSTRSAQRTKSTSGPANPDQHIIDFCNRGFTIVSIGRLSPEKGFNYLVEAFNLLIKRGINAYLLIIGEGSERKVLESLVERYNIKDNVLLPGYIKNARMYLPYCNVFVLSSLTEGLPITLLEAMEAKIPIIGTIVGGIPDVLIHGETGLLVKDQNPRALSEALYLLYNNDELSHGLAHNAFQVLRDKYSSNEMARKYYNVYKEIYFAN